MKPRDTHNDAAVWCPANCDYGKDGGKAVFRGRTMGEAMKARNAHLVSCHPDFRPPTGSMQDRVPKLD